MLQGALTHGDRRAGESRDLSRFNIDNKVCLFFGFLGYYYEPAAVRLLLFTGFWLVFGAVFYFVVTAVSSPSCLWME